MKHKPALFVTGVPFWTMPCHRSGTREPGKVFSWIRTRKTRRSKKLLRKCSKMSALEGRTLLNFAHASIEVQVRKISYFVKGNLFGEAGQDRADNSSTVRRQHRERLCKGRRRLLHRHQRQGTKSRPQRKRNTRRNQRSTLLPLPPKTRRFKVAMPP